jgi:hypothetical protein
MLIGLTSFENLLAQNLPVGVNGIVCVIKDACGTDISFEINGPSVTYLGSDDFHDPKFDHYMRQKTIELYPTTIKGLCTHQLYIYPSKKLRDSYNTNFTLIHTSVVVLAFTVTMILFLVFDR